MLDGAKPLKEALLVDAEEPTALLRKRKSWGRRRRQMNRGLWSWGLLGVGRGHVRSLASQADRPENDLGCQEYAADAEQVGKIADLSRFDSSIGSIQMPAARYVQRVVIPSTAHRIWTVLRDKDLPTQ